MCSTRVFRNVRLPQGQTTESSFAPATACISFVSSSSPVISGRPLSHTPVHADAAWIQSGGMCLPGRAGERARRLGPRGHGSPADLSSRGCIALMVSKSDTCPMDPGRGVIHLAGRRPFRSLEACLRARRVAGAPRTSSRYFPVTALQRRLPASPDKPRARPTLVFRVCARELIALEVEASGYEACYMRRHTYLHTYTSLGKCLPIDQVPTYLELQGFTKYVPQARRGTEYLAAGSRYFKHPLPRTQYGYRNLETQPFCKPSPASVAHYFILVAVSLPKPFSLAVARSKNERGFFFLLKPLL